MNPVPVRLRLSRARGFNLQAHSLATNGLPAVVVARPTKWGNSHDWREWRESFPRDMLVQEGPCFRDNWCRERAAEEYELDWRDGRMEHLRPHLAELQGRNLGCWCVGRGCHADTLLKLAAAPHPAPTPGAAPAEVA